MAQSNQGLWALFILQSICAVFFGFDALSDFLGWENTSPLQHLDIAEYAAAAILLASLWFSGKALARVMERNKRMKQQIGVASGAFHDLLEQHFEDWALTASEREVATLAICAKPRKAPSRPNLPPSTARRASPGVCNC